MRRTYSEGWIEISDRSLNILWRWRVASFKWYVHILVDQDHAMLGRLRAERYIEARQILRPPEFGALQVLLV